MLPFGGETLYDRCANKVVAHSPFYLHGFLPSLRTLVGNEGVFIPRDYVDDREGAIQLTETMGLGGESWAILSQVHTPPTQRPGTASQDGPTLAHVFAEANLFHEVLHSTLPLVIAYPWSDSRFFSSTGSTTVLSLL